MFWEDLEKPLSNLIIDPNAEANYLNYLAKKGLIKFNNPTVDEKSESNTATTITTGDK